jgi:UDP-N-acetylmuramoyl-tripeptide--D-alanyl-D-alanine ligase
MQNIVLFLLAFFARILIQKHAPYIIGVTGTIGKTTISHHIARMLEREYGKENVRYSTYHYNGEYGMPLTIFQEKTGGRNPVSWIFIFVRAFLAQFRPFPKYLVLEYGIDHPGEMEYLLNIAIPDIAIVAPVAPNHLEQF